MADKKTSQEISGAPIQGADLWRIARSGANYKLTSEELFTESITKADLATKATANGLIPGRYYQVIDTSEGAAMVQAQTVSTYSNIAITSSSNRSQLNQFTALGTTNGYIDNDANYFLGADWQAYSYSKNISNSVGYVSFTGSTVEGNIFLGGTYSLNNAIIQNNHFENCSVFSDGSACNISGCSFKNCTVQLVNSASLIRISIDGSAVSGVQYNFDGVALSYGTIVSGEFSTIQMDLDLGNYLTGTTLTIPANMDYVGQFNLKNFIAGAHVQYIDMFTNGTSNTHTPVKFQNAQPGVVLGTIHINKPSNQTAPYQIMFARHHGNTNDLHTIYSYIEGKIDPTNSLWAITDYVDYD